MMRPSYSMGRWTSTSNMKEDKEVYCFLHELDQPPLQPLIVDNQPFEAVNNIKLLGVYLSSEALISSDPPISIIFIPKQTPFWSEYLKT